MKHIYPSWLKDTPTAPQEKKMRGRKGGSEWSGKSLHAGRMSASLHVFTFVIADRVIAP